MSQRTVLIVGGTGGIGLLLAQRAVERGEQVVITGRDAARTEQIAQDLGGGAKGLGLDLTRPESIAGALSDVATVDHVVLSAVSRDDNHVADYNIEGATRLVVLKMVGYTEVVHTLLDRIPKSADSAVVVYGGRAKDRPYPGSTTVSSVNGGVDGLVRTLALQVAPIRVNALHPGIVGDSPFWAAKPAGVLDAYKGRTPSGELATMADVCDATEFLLRNRSVTGASLMVDCGWEVT